MQVLQRLNFLEVTAPVAINDNTAYTTTTIDTLGMGDELLVVIKFGAMDIAVAALKLQESNSSNMSGATDISGADFSVAPATLPSATSDNTFFGIHVKLGGARKRYLDLSFTAGDGAAGTYAYAEAIFTRVESDPSSATTRGFAQFLTV